MVIAVVVRFMITLITGTTLSVHDFHAVDTWF